MYIYFLARRRAILEYLETHHLLRTAACFVNETGLLVSLPGTNGLAATDGSCTVAKSGAIRIPGGDVAAADVCGSSSPGQSQSTGASSSELCLERLRFDNLPRLCVLEAKWVCVVRLQRKNLELESTVVQLNDALGATSARALLPSDTHVVLPLQVGQQPGRNDASFPAISDHPIHVLHGHGGNQVNCLAFHPYLPLLVSASDDATIKLWDYESGTYEGTFRGHTKAVTWVTFDTRQSMTRLQQKQVHVLASCSADSTIKLWQCTATLEGALIVAQAKVSGSIYGDHGAALAIAAGGGSGSGSPHQQRNQHRRALKTLAGHEDTVSCVAFVGGNSSLPPSSLQTLQLDLLASCSRDCQLKIWDLSTGFCITSISAAHGDWIRGLDCSEDGRWLAAVSSDQIGSLWGIGATGITASPKARFEGHDHVIECVVFVPTSFYMQVTSLLGVNTAAAGLKNPPSSYTLGPYVLTGGRDKTIRLWEGQTGHELHCFKGHENWVRSIHVYPTGRYFLSVGDDGTIRTWDLATGQCVSKIAKAHAAQFITSLGVSRISPAIATACSDGEIKIWTTAISSNANT